MRAMAQIKVDVLPITDGATPDPQNVNKHTQRGSSLLQNSLRKRGAFRSIASAGKGTNTPVIYAGNLTHEMAVDAGFTEIVNVHVTGNQLVNVVRDDIEPGSPEAIALGIEDNQIAEESYTPDVDVLAALAAGDNAVLSVLRQEDKLFDQMVKRMGADDNIEPQDAEPQIDRAEELRAKWGVELGQMWQLGEHRIICGDCTDRAVVELVMKGEKADCVFTDPPYGVAIGDKNKLLNSFQKAGRNLENIAGDLMGKDELFDMLVKSFTITREFMQDHATIYVTSPQGGELGMMMMMMVSGLPVRHVLTWVKNAPTFSMGRLDYDYKHEPIFYTWKKSHKFYGNGKLKNSVWEIDKPRASKEHPTMKPVELYENGYLNSSQENDIIYEPFSGSGTAIIACQNLGRKCRAVEISPAYVAVAIERFSQAFPGVAIAKL